jgi:DnaK suppressor protein
MLVQYWTAKEARLVQAREETISELCHLRQDLESEVDTEVDEADELISEHEIAAILIEMLENKVQDIEAALVAIETGRYEYCEHCGDVIDKERLDAKPDTRLCIVCQQASEQCKT